MKGLLTVLLLFAAPAWAQWTFSKPVAVNGEPSAGVFAHLESAGRRSLAVQGDQIAIVWEDNRSGSAQVYVALKPSVDAAFQPPQRLSTGSEAYEPAVTAAANGFVAAWEQDGGLRMRVVGADGAGPLYSLGGERAAQVTLHSDRDRLFAAWTERAAGVGRVLVTGVTIEGTRLQPGQPTAVDAVPPERPQLYPALAIANGKLVVAWEDRRAGHTRLFYTCSPLESLEFGALQPLNERRSSGAAAFGRGPGVTRVALAGNGRRIAAVWMDKRDFRGGYDTYAALLGEHCRFGANEKVQDMFGENTPQWHPAIAVAHDGATIAVWDDPRDGSPDLWLSERNDEGWSDDAAVEPAYGPGRQDNPAVAFDAEGRLHLGWLHAEDGAVVRVMYAVGKRTEAD